MCKMYNVGLTPFLLKETERHITIPRHASLKVGTLSYILKDVASYLEIEKERLIKDIFSL